MRFKTYIRVLNDEAVIRGLREAVRISGAMIRPTKARIRDTDAVWWNWQAPPEDVTDSNDVEDAVQAMLLKYRSFFPAIRQHRGPEAGTYLEVVHYYKENEKPCGLYLSVESVSLLSELGAALDYDVAPDVALEDVALATR